ncbi:hypothetical protein M408DRAFT_229222 [Serendipita vermifera MAFF 305830]|uniref:Uncharacterized protein n=1 Tax=Serendipita vermifera MAFF 305830 TaxID=933852 RepID=A0A0C3AZU5_SERVB|nr:hypothetical protein M408DRAFT_229222 [Serendipita vermifera MAFF 305830]
MVTTRSSTIEESHRGRRAAWRQASVASIVKAAKVAALVPKKLKDQQMAKVKSHHIMVQWTSWLDTLRMDDSHGLEIPEEGDIPQPDVLVAFASHYSEYARGIQSKKIRTKTLLNNMRSLVRMLETAWNISIPQETKRILNTACVGPLSEIHQLHSDPSERPIADLETLESIISVIWSEEFQPKYQRERIQYHALLLLFLFTAARVGTILESSTYYGSDEGLSYRDINLRVYPSSDDENDITLSGQLVLRYAKGNRTSEGRNFRYNIADTDHISKNLCRLLLLIGFLDNAWQDFESLDDLIQLRYRIPSKGMELRVKQESRYQAVFILESDGRLKRGNGVTRLPAVKAWHRFRELGQLAGLKDSFTIGSIRRLCANAINNPYFTDAQRRAAMAHADKSSVYASHYAAPQFNFQKVILNERGIDLPFATTSQTMDKKAPVRVSMATISNQLRQNKNFAADVHRQSLLKRAIIEQKGSIVSCQNLPVGKMYAKLHQRVQYYIGKARRETLHRARQAFFNSRVVLRIPRQVVKLPVHPSPILPIVQKPLPGHALLRTIREVVLGKDSKQGPADLKLLLSFSRLRTPLDSFYPDEEIVDNRCPQCALDMNTIRKVHRQSHVHRCRTNHKRKEATVSEKLVPSTRSLKESLSATRRIARKRVCTLEACGRHKR